MDRAVLDRLITRVRDRLWAGSRPLMAVGERGAAAGVPTDGEETIGDRMPGASGRAFWIGLAVVLLSLVSGLATFLILTGLTPIAPRNDVVVIVLFINIILIMAMCAVLGLQALGLWRAWQQKIAGARIHVRIVGLFTVIALLPALMLAIAATTSFSRSLDNWFSNRTRTIVANSLDVANAYIAEHGQVIRTDAVNMARDIDDIATNVKDLLKDRGNLRNLLVAQAGLRDLSLAVIVDETGQSIIEAAGDTRVRFQPPDVAIIRQAEAGNVPLLMPNENFRVAAVTKLQQFPGFHLYVARAVDPKVVGHLRSTQAAVAEYERLRAARGGLKLVHGVMYFMISLTGVLAAIWVGLWFARQLVAPIRRLIGAAQRVAHGDLDVVLPLRRGEGDLRRLSRDFNHMTRELSRQRNDLVAANDQLTERRRFMEAVLSGVTAGVIGLDAQGRIRLANRSAEQLLGHAADALVGRNLSDVVPPLGALIESERDNPIKQRGQAQISFVVGGEERNFAVRVTREQEGDGGGGSVVTFDDITELVSAQRASAWGDVARRIAHEIKNPLTPIQLSAERLRRKYAASILTDRETFEKLTDTIVRQVGDIKTMVDEFASFARIPKPQMEPTDIGAAALEPVILFRESHPAIDYVLRQPATPVIASCDRRLVTQALTNLVKNATESVETAAEASDRDPDWRGNIETIVRQFDDRVEIDVIDNGLGLPKQNRARLLEPYVTTKGHKGTGLGLAIVQKITEQHGGRLTLDDAPEAPGRKRGARVRLTLPIHSRRGEGREQTTELAEVASRQAAQ